MWGTGFKPHDQVYVIECLATSKSEAGCDLKTLHPVKITATGVLPAFNFKVRHRQDRHRHVRHEREEPEVLRHLRGQRDQG